MKRTGIIFALLIAITFLPLSAARANELLVTDISSHLISVTSDFTGTDLLLFGAIKTAEPTDNPKSGDIIVVVRGPQKELIVRKKERVAGIWINTKAVQLSKVPGFYAVASNRDVSLITSEATLNRLKIGSSRLNLPSPSTDNGTNTEFRQAVIRQQTESELYSNNQASVYFLGNTLFRTSIHFPANVPVGNYVAEVYLFLDGELLSAQTTPLFIKKFGLGRRINDFAQTYPYLHGIAAIVLALLAGWIASVIFRKD